MTEASSLVSIVVPLHNKAAFVGETIRSVCKQTHSDLEAIVVENGSNDGGPDVVRQCIDERVRLIVALEHPRGPAMARNLGLRQARGDWILFLDADDIIEPDHLQRLLGVANEHSKATVVAGGWKEFVDGKPGEMSCMRPASDGVPERLGDRAIATSPWAVHAAIVHRDLALLHPWPEHMDGLLAEDNAFWFSICLHGQVAFSDSAGAIYRTQTPRCRTQSNNVRKWYTGVSTAVDENVAALTSLGRTPNTEQAATLMRLFSRLYNQAVQDGEKQITALASEKANDWLRLCNNRSRSIALRKLLGIRLFERIRRWIR